MKELKFPLLTKDDIELRIGQMSNDKTKASLLLYQDARCGMKYLDLVVGCGNWQKKYYEVRGLVLCSIGIYDEDRKEWVWKDDTGSAGSIEEEKSIVSDSFKRACVCWGLARELYTAPNIWVKVSSKYDKFKVRSISYNENREIISLEIETEKGELAYSYGTGKKVPTQAEKPQNKTSNVSDEQYEKDVAIINTYYDSVPESKKSQFNDWVYKVTSYNTLDDLFEDKARTHRIAEVIRDNK